MATLACSAGNKSSVLKGEEARPETAAETVSTAETAGAEDKVCAVVVTDKLELRSKPRLDGEVVAELRRGEEAVLLDPWEYTSARLTRGFRWVKVRAQGKSGWAAKDYLVWSEHYDDCREADRLALAGDAAGMVAALRAIVGDDEWRIRIGPDGDRAVIQFVDSFAALESNVFYFESGRGLVRSLPYAVLDSEFIWSPDGKYVVTGLTADPGGTNMFHFCLYDAARDEILYDGRVQSLYVEATDKREFTFEFRPGYFVWLEMERVDKSLVHSRYDYWPALWAMDLATGEKTRVLEPVPSTYREHPKGEKPRRPDEILMRPVPGELPEGVRGSGLFQRFNGAYAEVGWTEI
jgi:hypothetical protein